MPGTVNDSSSGTTRRAPRRGHDRGAEPLQAAPPVTVGAKNPAPFDPAGDDVVNRARSVEAWSARHDTDA